MIPNDHIQYSQNNLWQSFFIYYFLGQLCAVLQCCYFWRPSNGKFWFSARTMKFAWGRFQSMTEMWSWFQMDKLELKLESELPSSAKVVACRFPFPNWVPEHTAGEGVDTVWVYNAESFKSLEHCGAVKKTTSENGDTAGSHLQREMKWRGRQTIGRSPNADHYFKLFHWNGRKISKQKQKKTSAQLSTFDLEVQMQISTGAWNYWLLIKGLLSARCSPSIFFRRFRWDVAYPRWLWAIGGRHSRLVTSQSQGTLETNNKHLWTF